MHDVITAFGREVHKRRTAYGWSLEALGAAASLTPNYIRDIEAGRRNPSLITALAIAKAFDVHLGDLLGGIQELSPDALEGGRLIDAIPPEVRRPLLNVLRALAEPLSRASNTAPPPPPTL